MASEHTCAACGKGEGDGANLKTCTACKSVKYCSVACQKLHRPSHKKECRARAAQLFDEALFKQPPPEEDCAICFLQLPYAGASYAGEEIPVLYKSCCGKRLCHGCMYANHGCMFGVRVGTGNGTCPFCRKPMAKSHDEERRRCTKRMEAGDADAFHFIGIRYLLGRDGLPQDIDRGLELSERAAELGSAHAQYNVAAFYSSGEYAPRNAKKALFHNQQAAMKGHMISRDNLGCDEGEIGNLDRAIKHWMIATASGNKSSLDKIQDMFTRGMVSKAQYESALRAYQSHQEEVKSDQRTRAIEFIRAHNQTNSAG